MKKTIILLILQLLSVTFIFAQDASQVKPVQNVDLKKYTGKWFEIARYPNKFQKNCVGNTMATYTIKEDKTIEVLNECLEKDGKVNQAKGKAKVADKTTNAKLKVRFAPSFLSFLPQVWGDYWIIDLDENYQYAAVGDPKREYFWILSREPEMSDTTFQAILRRAENMGFNPGKVAKTSQNIEVIKGEIIRRQ